MIATIGSMFDSALTGSKAGPKESTEPEGNLSAPAPQNAASDPNPLRGLVDWFLQGNAADRKAARELEDMMERLSKLPPHLLDDINVIADPHKALHFDDLIMSAETLFSGPGETAKPAATPFSFYLSERFASK